MSKYGQSKSTGRQEASSDSKGFVLSFSPRVHVLKTQMCILRYGSASFATSAGHLCYEQLKVRVLVCPEENQRHKVQKSSQQSVSNPLLPYPFVFLIPGRELFTIPPNRVSACQWNGTGSAAPQTLQEAKKPSLWTTQRSNEQQELHSGPMLKSHLWQMELGMSCSLPWKTIDPTQCQRV